MVGPSASAHQVLVYSGPGVSPLSLSHTLLTLSLLLLPHYTVQPITPLTLATQPWEPACALLVIPGGRDLPYVEELTMKTKMTRRIREFVQEGGRYLGICAGAYFGAAEVRFDTGGDLEVVGQRDLAFFPGPCAGPTFPGFAYAAESGSRAVSLILDTPSSSSQTLDHIYYNGGGHFVLPSPLPESVRVLARYAEQSTSSRSTALEGLPVAAVLNSKGKGKAVLCSVHFEYPLNDPPARDAIAKLEIPPDKEILEGSETARIGWAREMLELLDLKPPGRRPQPIKSAGLNSVDNPALLLHPSHPSPIFVLPHPALPQLGSASFASPPIASKLTEIANGKRTLCDSNDELHLFLTSVLHSGADETEDAVTQFLAEKRRNPPVCEPQIDQLSIAPSTSSPAPPQPQDLHSVPKFVLLPSPDVPYTPLRFLAVSSATQ